MKVPILAMLFCNFNYC